MAHIGGRPGAAFVCSGAAAGAVATPVLPPSQLREQCEWARLEFFRKAAASAVGEGVPKEGVQLAALYMETHGRAGEHRARFKNGKKSPRYVIDRDEIWVVYKPALWSMGGSETAWVEQVEELKRKHSSPSAAQAEMLKSDAVETLQTWHRLTHGVAYLDPERPLVSWGFVQRLDPETDGPIVICKTWRAQRFLQVQLREQLVSKGHLCLVHGRIEDGVGQLKQRFVEIGSEATVQVILAHDRDHDPFFEFAHKGNKSTRNVKVAETLFKPLAYYMRAQDGTSYTLVYVNTFTNITHQVRVAMQSLGHPVVSDDRYLPRGQALKDLLWCPRSFVTEVRTDFFDIAGSHRDPARRRYTRVSVESPLPRTLQKVLEKKLKLAKQLDVTADLYAGCQYWALGDEQLIAAHPKSDKYRQKVLRWGQRRGIHLDALDRLLLLPEEEIDELIMSHKAPQDPEDSSWVCPECLGYNFSSGGSSPSRCAGYLRKSCPGVNVISRSAGFATPKGWSNWISDPTLHFLMKVNPKWLDARRYVLGGHLDTTCRKGKLPSSREADGSAASEDVLLGLEAKLVSDAKSGVYAIREEDLPGIPGLESVRLPLSFLPEDSSVKRMRLPGQGLGSQWTYALKAKSRSKFAEGFSVLGERLTEPVPVITEPLPEKMVIDDDGADALLNGIVAIEVKDKEEEVVSEPPWKRRREEGDTAQAGWVRIESRSRPGTFYYYNAATDESERFPLLPKPPWSLVESKVQVGQFYYFNPDTKEMCVDPPAGSRPQERGAISIEDGERLPLGWVVKSSATRLGSAYYYHEVTGEARWEKPALWEQKQSKSTGSFYYVNIESGQTSWEAPT